MTLPSAASCFIVPPSRSSITRHAGHWKSSQTSRTGAVTPGCAIATDPSCCRVAGASAPL
ncbi:hypothetical protein LUW74_04245 [Actinomadura madurae]|uniref:hypothetical protein n=1 Tax=Actinomadura madurae TaxID=1993 RepID=UPI002025F2BF|nr:hypothetical protein [Actinomadura madurae]URN10906.1 hypothetical protein LUW74_04245 [Actinomadura madurae]